MSKSTVKSAKSTAPDAALKKVKSGGVTKSSQSTKSKSKELAKAVAGKEEKKKSKKVIKEPTPESSSDEEEEEEDSDESEDSADAESADSGSDSESDSESEDEEEVVEQSKPTKQVKLNGAKAAEDSSDESDESDESEESDSDDEDKPAAAANDEGAKSSEDDDDSSDEDEEEEDSDESDSDEAPPAKDEVKTTKRKAEEDAEPISKKTKTEETGSAQSANLFVGNLSWNVDEAWLREEFQEFGEISAVRLMTDRQSGRSKGFGYVEFVSAEDAAKAHTAKAGAELDGRPMNVDFAKPQQSEAERNTNRRKSYGDQVGEATDTLFLGNLSFEAGQEEITELFTPYGTIMGVRLPTDRETGQPKGFGYVNYSSVDEAKAALEGLQGYYLNSRPLRLDFSSPRPQTGDSPARGGFGGRGGRGGFGGRGGRGGNNFSRGGGRGGARGGRGGSFNRGGASSFAGKKTTF